jgi:hypothetical protein
MRRRDSFLPLWVLVGLLAVPCGPRAFAQTIDDPNAASFALSTPIALPTGVPRPLGGLRLSANGATLYLVGAASSNTSAVYSLTVVRNLQNRITGFTIAV